MTYKIFVKQVDKTLQDTGITKQFVGVFKGEQKVRYYFKIKYKTPRH